MQVRAVDKVTVTGAGRRGSGQFPHTLRYGTSGTYTRHWARLRFTPPARSQTRATAWRVSMVYR